MNTINFTRRTMLALGSALALAGALPAHAAEPTGLDLSRYKGKVVLVDFWASWCGPCKQSFPFMQGLAGRYGANDLVVLTVNVDRQRPAADAFLKQVRYTLPVVWDSKGDIARAWKVNDMPTSLVFDRDGKMRFRHQGFFPNKAGEYEGHVAQLVRER